VTVPDVSAELTAVLNAKNDDGSAKYRFEDFQATFPPMMISLLAHVPFEQMAPEAQELVVLAMGQVGLEVGASVDDVAAKVTAYVAAHPPNEELLHAIRGVLLKAAGAQEDAGLEASKKLTGEKLAAPKLHEPKPEGSVDVRKLSPKIRM
jgi:hypothetical protein